MLLPNTFVYPVTGRKHLRLEADEDERYVVQTPKKQQNVYNLFTRADLTMLFDKGAEIYPVRSCFGGLAVYRLEVYLESQCGYAADPVRYNPNERYSNAFTPHLGKEGSACEHVLLHECLRATRGLRAAIGRDVKVLWSRISQWDTRSKIPR